MEPPYVCYGGGGYPNRSGAASGVAQANPGDKMASVAPDWTTDPLTQVTWGEGYIQGAYGDPQNAFDHATAGCSGGADCNGCVIRQLH